MVSASGREPEGRWFESSHPDQMTTAEKEPETIEEMAVILIREGYLQEKDRDSAERVRARWELRENVPQSTVKDLKERASLVSSLAS